MRDLIEAEKPLEIREAILSSDGSVSGATFDGTLSGFEALCSVPPG